MSVVGRKAFVGRATHRHKQQQALRTRQTTRPPDAPGAACLLSLTVDVYLPGSLPPPAPKDAAFLPLDDLLEEGKNIDLPLGRLSVPQGGRAGTTSRRTSAVGAGSSADGGGVKDGGAGASLASAKARASMISRPPMFLMEQDYGNSFKMSTCAVDQVWARQHPLGTMFLVSRCSFRASTLVVRWPVA